MTYLILAIAAYFFIVFIVFRLITPHLGFRRSALPQEIPLELAAVVADLNNQARSDIDFVRKVFDYITNRYYGNHVKTITRFWQAWQDPLIASPGFLHCNRINHILRVMLIKSGRFTDDDIKLVIIITKQVFIHQYLKVHVGKEWIRLDPWAHFKNIPHGKNFR